MKGETKCSFWLDCDLYETKYCNDPEVYNGTESECPLYFGKVKEVINLDKKKQSRDNIIMKLRDKKLQDYIDQHRFSS